MEEGERTELGWEGDQPNEDGMDRLRPRGGWPSELARNSICGGGWTTLAIVKDASWSPSGRRFLFSSPTHPFGTP